MILKHPTLPGISADVPSHLVAIWEKSGWQAPTVEVPSRPAKKRRPRRTPSTTERASNA